MRRVVRHVLAFAVAPVLVPLAWAGFMAALGEWPDPDDPAAVACSGLATELGICLAGGWVFTLGLGGPVLLALRRAGRATVPWTVGLGAAAGAVALCALFLAVVSRGSDRRGELTLATLIGAALGAAVAAAFCAIAGVPLRRAAPALPGAATSPPSP